MMINNLEVRYTNSFCRVVDLVPAASSETLDPSSRYEAAHQLIV